MRRSVVSCVRILKQTNHSSLGGLITKTSITISKSSNTPVPIVSIDKCIHTCSRLQDDDDKSNVIKRKPQKKKDDLLSKEKELLQSAAIDAAQSLPGDWNRTADELMSRLSVTTEQRSEDGEGREPSPQQSSLLSTMKVGRNFERPVGRNANRQGGDDSVTGKIQMRKRLARKTEIFTSIYSQKRLGIFDANKLKALATEGEVKDSAETSLWHIVEKEKLSRARGSLPKNGFEEMIQWTKEGRMWSFPVDNEEDMHEERQYEFHQHVFLNQHMKDFPTEGPLRRFMDLVVIGLSNNPWISVPEKIEHIRWYADYFKEKQKLLETSIGDKAVMKSKDDAMV